MDINQLKDAIMTGTPVKNVIHPGEICELNFPAFGDICFRILVRSSTALKFSGGTVGGMQRIYIMLQQDTSGNADVSWPENIVWLDQSGQLSEKAPFVDSRAGALIFATIMQFDSGKQYYGRANF